jgi:hypothetical protein
MKMKLYFWKFLYLFFYISISLLAAALDERDMMSTRDLPVQVRACYDGYHLLVSHDNLDYHIEDFKRFDPKQSPWLGFAMRFNAVLDIIITNNDHTKLAILRLAVAKPYAYFIRPKDPDVDSRHNQILNYLSFRRYNNWSTIM